MTLKRAANAVLFALVLLMIACSKSGSQESATVKSDSQRKPAPTFTLKDGNGSPLKLADYKGKVVLLNFWATWCGPCKVEIPWFIEFQQKYKDQGFTVLGVSMDDDGWKSVRPYVANHKMNYPIVIGTEELSQLYGSIDSLPTTFILDREGRIAASHNGLIDKSDYEHEIVNLLADQKHSALEHSGSRNFAFFLQPAF